MNKKDDPFASNSPSSDEYGFEEGHDPLHKDEAQAEASEYGIYGYHSEPGEAFENEPSHPPDERGEPEVEEESSDPSITPAQGGQRWNQSEHGAGFDQPAEHPQRDASRSELPDDTDAEGA